ncbi:Alpha/Beta hydrolase protein [Boletus edulis BED1]|uniref:Carboxylic ester hydrolase n=1 Tax=Boletus edulis BED1 TaxID=1328754 RepID=A0AAD4G9G7_BOLED|nr:Alpha/Beta hydrolase protein [Boletus edulis BED1]
MVLTCSFIPLVFQVLALTSHLPTCRSADAPVVRVTLDYGTFQGFNSAGDTESYLGLPFAQPPVGQLRFNNPVPPQPFLEVRNATWFGNACPQQVTSEVFTVNPGLRSVLQYIEELLPATLANASEDCLYLNVVKPAGVRAGANLPVVVWIYGGAFETGDASGFNGTRIVSRSMELKTPVIYPTADVTNIAFGFLGGKEVQAAGLGNFGLYDQRFALQWVQKYIYLFGGNPQQVIISGQSAGATSVLVQMVAYDGQSDGLFHGGVMVSGSVNPNFDISYPRAQGYYDFLVAQTNCSVASDTLDCLRQAPYESIYSAVMQIPSVFSYQAVNLSWGPLVDGVFLKQSTRQSLSQGKYAQGKGREIRFHDYVNVHSSVASLLTKHANNSFLVGVPQQEIQKVGMVYEEDPTLGSPYGVGTNDTLTPEYKRIASFQGDFYFQAPRRYTLRHLSRTQDVWSYLWKRNKTIPTLGSFHGSDLQEFYDVTGNTDWVGTDALVNFAYTLNPNVPPNGYPVGAAQSLLANVYWPQYHPHNPQLLTFEDSDVLTLTNDTYRAEQINVLDQVQDLMGWQSRDGAS